MSHRLALPLCALIAVGGLSACSDDEPEATETTATPPIEVPEGVTLTEPGADLDLGEAASVVHEANRKKISAITVRVTSVRKGNMRKDFRNFSLDKKQLHSTPYYVSATVRNEGPADLGGTSVPLYGFDTTSTAFPGTTLVGTFDKCPGGVLPDKFKPGTKERTCVIFLVPPGEKLQEVQLRTDPEAEPVVWPV